MTTMQGSGTMDSSAIIAARDSYISDSEFIAAANEASYTWRETWIRWTTVAGKFGAGVADSVHTALAGMSAPRAAAFIDPGFDIGNEVTRMEMQAMAAAKPELAQLVDWALAQGRSVTRPCEAWGVSEMTEAVLAAARHEVAVIRASGACHAAAYAGQMAANDDPSDAAAIESAMVAELRAQMGVA